MILAVGWAGEFASPIHLPQCGLGAALSTRKPLPGGPHPLNSPHCGPFVLGSRFEGDGERGESGGSCFATRSEVLLSKFQAKHAKLAREDKKA